MSAGRREFLQGLSGTFLIPRLSRRAPVVHGAGTVFYGHPQGITSLVRFSVTGTEAPAGRLRVYDARRRLLGTAGVIRRGDRLYGELWLEITEPSRIVTELDLPGQGRPLTSTHSIRPGRRWTLYWMTVADPDLLDRHLRRLPLWSQIAAQSAWRHTGVAGNPYGAGPRAAAETNHLEFIRSATRAAQLTPAWGLPPSGIAVLRGDDLNLRTIPMLLRGVGVSVAVRLDAAAASPPFTLWTAPDGSQIVAVDPPAGGTPEALAFAAGGDPMAQAVEAWLTHAPQLLAPGYPSATVIISTAIEDERGAMVRSVRQWNDRFAFPRLVVGSADEFFRDAIGHASTGTTSPRPGPDPTNHPVARLDAAASARREDAKHHLTNLFEPVERMLTGTALGLEGLARLFDFRFRGHLVFNPSPQTRSDVAEFPDGTQHFVTDVPGLGYVFLPAGTSSPIRLESDSRDLTLRGQRLTLRFDPITGAVRSIVDRIEDREWVPPDSRGAFHFPDRPITGMNRVRVRGVGMRLTVTQTRVDGLPMETVYTVYDDHPWVDVITNHGAAVRDPTHLVSDFALPPDAVEWEVPLGFEERELDAPVSLTHLRWMSVRGPRGWRIMLRGLDSPFATVAPVGNRGVRVSVPLGSGRHRFRFAVASPHAPLDEPWFFGWGAEPFRVVTVDGDGSFEAPTYARLFRVDPGIMVVGVHMAPRGFGAVVYLQNTAPVDRRITVEPGLLRFDRAAHVDFAGRELGELPVGETGTGITIGARAVMAVRLSGLTVGNP